MFLILVGMIPHFRKYSYSLSSINISHPFTHSVKQLIISLPVEEEQVALDETQHYRSIFSGKMTTLALFTDL